MKSIYRMFIFFSAWPIIFAQDTSGNYSRQFPDSFLFGSATSSYQIEGAWDTYGKAESIWDYMTHNNPGSIADGSNGDVACDSYHKWQRDVEMLRELGVSFYRFSLSWPRLMPDAPSNNVNQLAVEYYSNLINELLLYNIEPVITLYHWDLPQKLQLLGGWTHPMIVEYFTDFARIAYTLFGDRVKTWVTINEPKQICQYGYGFVRHAPQAGLPGLGEYWCTRYILLAHASSWHLYNDEFRATQGGICGLNVHTQWYQGATDSAEDVQAAIDAEAFEQDIYLHPIFSESGDWPVIVKERVAQRSLEQNYTSSRLPEFSTEEISYMIGSSDFIGVNSYSSQIATRASAAGIYLDEPSSYSDMDASLTSWPSTMEQDNNWSLYQMFLKLRDDYGNYPIYMFENGLGSEPGLNDVARAELYRGALLAVLDALRDGADIRAYTAWSLMDNFEWSRGYTLRFGLYQVDFESEEKTRTPRLSAYMYQNIVQNRRIDFDYWPSIEFDEEYDGIVDNDIVVVGETESAIVIENVNETNNAFKCFGSPGILCLTCILIGVFNFN